MSSPPKNSIWFQGKGPLHVPVDTLKKCPKLVARLNHTSEANLQDISLPAGHIIIHFLVTERYQGLKPSGATEDERNCSELTTAFRVYAHAETLKLPRLQELAQSEMQRLGSKMNLISVAQTLDESGFSLDKYPVLEEQLSSQIDLALTQSSKKGLDSLITQLGVPKSVSMFFLEHILESQKSLLDPKSCNKEETSTDLTWAQFGQEFQALVQKFSKQDPIDENLTFQPELLEMAISESEERRKLEMMLSTKGRLNNTDRARLETLKRNAALRAELLADCETDMVASRERVRQLGLDAQGIAERMIQEQSREALLQCRKEQHGLLSFQQIHHTVSPEGYAKDLSQRRRAQSKDAEEASSQTMDESSDDGIMTPNTDSATETPSLPAKDDSVRPGGAQANRIAKLRMEKKIKRLNNRFKEEERLARQFTRGDWTWFIILFIILIWI
ncbi:hypothetical protein ACHAP5_003840 [Fusarium lateritium]